MPKKRSYLAGLLLASLSFSSPANDGGKGFAGGVLDCQPSLSAASNPELSLSAYTDQSSYRIGDALKVTVQASQDAYISLLDHGSLLNRIERMSYTAIFGSNRGIVMSFQQTKGSN